MSIKIHSIRLPFMAWRKSLNHTVPKPFKVLNIIDNFFGKPRTYQYMSDEVIKYCINVKFTNGKVFKVRACGEVRYYLYKKYLNDECIYGRAR